MRSDFGEHSEAMYLTSSFVFDDAEQAAARFQNREPGMVYSRFTNPSVQMFEERLASLENAERAVATSSGMSAILATCMGLLKASEHIVATPRLFGATIQLFDNYMVKNLQKYLTNGLMKAVSINADAKLLEVFGKPQVTMFELAGILGQHGISIASFIQHEAAGNGDAAGAAVPLIIMTHHCGSNAMAQALAAIERSATVRGTGVCLPVLDDGQPASPGSPRA